MIDYASGLVSNEGGKASMQLLGKIYHAAVQQQPQIRDFRGIWIPLEQGVVQQFFGESIDIGKTWYPWFNGYYFSVQKEQKDAE